MINPDNKIKMNKIMNAINEVKMLAAQKGLTLTYLAEYLSKHTNKKYSLDSLSKKLRANTIRYSEMNFSYSQLTSTTY